MTAPIRRVVIHADDLGMSHGANMAFAELCAFGTCTSGSVMVPCPWFVELAAMAGAAPALDIGVHLTLTSEMSGYRWRPLTRPPASAGLTDADGFFHPDTATVRARADREAVRVELEAQIDQALAAGIDVTHLDDHMGAVLAPEFLDITVDIACRRRLPLVLCPSLSDYGGPHNMVGADDDRFRRGIARAAAQGLRVFDRIVETDWSRTGAAEPIYRAMIAGLGEGTSFLALHFTRPGDIEAIDPEGYRLRTEEHALFSSPEFRAFLRDGGVQGMEFVGMRQFREELRQNGRQHAGQGV
ncbi:ChbG/HpnK family deacetylase [Frigidibacter sp. ROC022]|uniref:ChbG/HpnK family deacetylase n=1 Tax=Frigidibacter sp. ROC022 TaxID=2971796 RepID=UPI00215B3702|nr:ChbG/HpnK family deacetylase [Frigidibacter sp. ROC022]MCR8723536.1 ChbG/HpnK family deacetylase [Frigidibacter sp. ROC022]